jgi:hypothetical protein
MATFLSHYLCVFQDSADGTPQMAITACYSLAEGQDNSHIPDIEQIRASTFTDGSHMVVLPLNNDDDDDDEDNSSSDDADEGKRTRT